MGLLPRTKAELLAAVIAAIVTKLSSTYLNLRFRVHDGGARQQASPDFGSIASL